MNIAFFPWEISVVQIELCIDWALSMNSHHRIPIQQQGTRAFFYTIVLVSNSSSGVKKCMHHRVSKDGEKC